MVPRAGFCGQLAPGDNFANMQAFECPWVKGAQHSRPMGEGTEYIEHLSHELVPGSVLRFDYYAVVTALGR